MIAAARHILNAAEAVIGLVLPRSCAACWGEDGVAEGLCESCTRRLLSLAALPYCPGCGSTLAPHVRGEADECWQCAPGLRFSGVARIGPYAPPLRPLLQQMKYHRRDVLRRRIGRMLAVGCQRRFGDAPIDVVVPVPMHWRRRLMRGTDHAWAIARAVAAAMRIPAGRELTRIRHTPPQWNLPRSRRAANVRGAFAASRHGVRDARVLLVDDITTTGATASECARALRDAGAADVLLAVVAKAEAAWAYTKRLEDLQREGPDI